MYNKIIHSLIKDESHILNDWILHNILNIEFDHIYIYDDQSEKPISEIISILPSEIISKITVFRIEENINFYNNIEFSNSIYYDEDTYLNNIDNKQFYFQNYFLKQYRDISKWCLFCDVDEFIYLNDDYTLDNILNEHYDNDIIYIPWLIYGSSFNINQPDGLIIDNFKYHDYKYHQLGKSICKLDNIEIIDHAHCITKNKLNFSFDHNKKIFNLPIHINHYQINSIKLYIKRKLRSEIGHTNGTVRVANDIFSFMLSYNSVYSDSMDKYKKNINNILKKNLSNMDINLNYKYSSNSLYVDNKLYLKISSYDDLYKILYSNDIKFLKFEDELPKDFNIVKYKKLNKDLSEMNDVELLNHYILFGKNEKRDYGLNEKIDLKNDDSLSIDEISSDDETLSNKFEEDSDDSISDDESIEENDNSLLPFDFDVIVYKELNKDLSNLSNINAIYHYINNGINEKRKYKRNILPLDFDPEIYKKLNKDLKNLTDEEATNHYLTNGIDEKRKYKKNNIYKDKNNLPPDDFDPVIYKKLNKDLKNLTDEEATNHYLTNGINEKRIYIINNCIKDKNDLPPDDFDPVIYKKLNKDLKKLTDEEATKHYLTKGINEKRSYTKNGKIENSKIEISKNENISINKLPDDFNVVVYKSLNKDLVHLSNDDAILHYINNGKNENRKYKTIYDLPDDFDPISYKKLNKDLQHMTDNEAITHYLINGIDEKRRYVKYKSS